MRNPDRIDNFLRLLGEEWKKQGTDLRFTQFLFNNGIDNLGGMLYHLEESELLEQAFPDIQPREYLYWGTYGKNGYQPLQRKLIKDLDTDHIRAILDTQHLLTDNYIKIFNDELKLRKE